MKIGDYVRTEISSMNIQRIGKIEKIISNDFIHTDIGTYNKEYIIKSSPNIIDLIEEGDYVNGEIARLKIYNSNEAVGLILGEYDTHINFVEDIKSIITREQFEAMKYIVEGDE